ESSFGLADLRGPAFFAAFAGFRDFLRVMPFLPVCPPSRTAHRASGTRTGALIAHDAERIAVGVLEPRDLHAVADMHVAVAFETRHIVVLERNALGLQLLHGLFEFVAERPGHRRRLVRAGELGAVHEDVRLAAAEGDDLVAEAGDLLQA